MKKILSGFIICLVSLSVFAEPLTYDVNGVVTNVYRNDRGIGITVDTRKNNTYVFILDWDSAYYLEESLGDYTAIEGKKVTIVSKNTDRILDLGDEMDGNNHLRDIMTEFNYRKVKPYLVCNIRYTKDDPSIILSN